MAFLRSRKTDNCLASIKLIILSSTILAMTFAYATVHACTTWASTGSVNATPGTIVVKNRDAGHHGLEKIQIFHPKNAYAYLALVYKSKLSQKNYSYISAGINSQGLVVVNNAASSTPTQNRDQGETITMRNILAHFNNVTQVISAQHSLFTTNLVNNLIIGDSRQIAVIEIGKQHQYNIKTTTNGVLYHTNQYEAKNLQSQNTIVFPDSLMRYKTIGTLLHDHKQPYTFNYFQYLTNRQFNGLNSSIFRKWTVATWIASIPVDGCPSLYVRFTNPQQPYHVYRLTMCKPFWQQKSLPHDPSQ